jgi:signal transduction histidine kinase
MNVDLEYIVVFIIVLAVIITFTLLAYRIYILRIVKEKNLQHQLETQYQLNILEQCIKIQEKERERIALKLHDDIGNKLNILSVWLNNPKSWKSESSKEIVLKQIPELIETTRSLSHSLYPVNLERFGLVIAIEELMANVESSLIIEFILLYEYKPRIISIEVQLYRIIQEFLNNVLKHAQANKMRIYLRDSENMLSLLLSDNGKGFPINSISKGMGLRNMEMRINSIGAIFKWKNRTNYGSRLIILIPKT